jgi:DNA repair ATPase RecN
MAMQRETTYTGIMGELRRTLDAFNANAGGELGYLETQRNRVSTLLDRAAELARQQAALTATRQDVSKRLKTTIEEALRSLTALRVALKDHFGPRSEKLVEFGIQPFRGRKPKTETPTIEPEVPAAGPSTPSSDN